MRDPRALAAVVLLLMTGCSDELESHYDNHRLMVEDGAVARGWVPWFVPPSATDIHERHDLDTNEVWLRFTFDPDDLRSMVRPCREVSSEEVTYPGVTILTRADWWPASLTGLSLPSRMDSYYRCANGRTGFLAVDVDSATAYYWER